MCVNVWSFSRHTDVSFLRGGKTQNKKKQKNASQCFLFPFSRLMLGAVCRTVPKGSAVVQRPASSPYTPLQRSRQRRPPEHTAQSHFLSKRNRLALSVEKKRVRLMWCSFNSHRRHHITLQLQHTYILGHFFCFAYFITKNNNNTQNKCSASGSFKSFSNNKASSQKETVIALISTFL